MSDEFSIVLSSKEGYQFSIDFGLPGVAPLLADASPPVGKGDGPDSEKLLLSAVANCLSSSLLFALNKFHNDAVAIRTTASGTLVRNEKNRLRVGSIEVNIHLGVAASELKMLDRALAQFEDFCVVTQSVRTAIPVTVTVTDGSGAVLTA